MLKPAVFLGHASKALFIGARFLSRVLNTEKKKFLSVQQKNQNKLSKRSKHRKQKVKSYLNGGACPDVFIARR